MDYQREKLIEALSENIKLPFYWNPNCWVRKMQWTKKNENSYSGVFAESNEGDKLEYISDTGLIKAPSTYNGFYTVQGEHILYIQSGLSKDEAFESFQKLLNTPVQGEEEERKKVKMFVNILLNKSDELTPEELKRKRVSLGWSAKDLMNKLNSYAGREIVSRENTITEWERGVRNMHPAVQTLLEWMFKKPE